MWEVGGGRQWRWEVASRGKGVGGVGREVGGRWVAPNRTVPTGTSSKETAGNANRTEPTYRTEP